MILEEPLGADSLLVDGFEGLIALADLCFF
jgi:hypothetical protein